MRLGIDAGFALLDGPLNSLMKKTEAGLVLIDHNQSCNEYFLFRSTPVPLTSDVILGVPLFATAVVTP